MTLTAQLDAMEQRIEAEDCAKMQHLKHCVCCTDLPRLLAKVRQMQRVINQLTHELYSSFNRDVPDMVVDALAPLGGKDG